MRVGAAILYVAVMLGVVVLFNAGIGEALLIWSAVGDHPPQVGEGSQSVT